MTENDETERASRAEPSAHGVLEDIEVGGLTLRAPRPDDVSWVFDACQDPDIQRFTRVPSPYRPGDAVAFLNLSRTARAYGAGYHFVITLTETGELLGAIGVGPIDRSAGSAEFGYWLGVDGRGHGIATQAVAGIGQWCAHELGLVLLSATVVAGNRRGEAVLQRNGFACISREAVCSTGRGELAASCWQREL